MIHATYQKHKKIPSFEHQRKLLSLFKSSILTSGDPLPLSHFGFSYYILFVNDFNKYTWLLLMKKKSNILLIFQTFKL